MHISAWLPPIFALNEVKLVTWRCLVCFCCTLMIVDECKTVRNWLLLNMSGPTSYSWIRIYFLSIYLFCFWECGRFFHQFRFNPIIIDHSITQFVHVSSQRQPPAARGPCFDRPNPWRVASPELANATRGGGVKTIVHDSKWSRHLPSGYLLHSHGIDGP